MFDIFVALELIFCWEVVQDKRENIIEKCEHMGAQKKGNSFRGVRDTPALSGGHFW